MIYFMSYYETSWPITSIVVISSIYYGILINKRHILSEFFEKKIKDQNIWETINGQGVKFCKRKLILHLKHYWKYPNFSLQITPDYQFTCHEVKLTYLPSSEETLYVLYYNMHKVGLIPVLLHEKVSSRLESSWGSIFKLEFRSLLELR